jgi:hypothetical protein
MKTEKTKAIGKPKNDFGGNQPDNKDKLYWDEEVGSDRNVSAWAKHHQDDR